VVWPVANPPIVKGAVLVGPDGRVVAVGPDATVPRPAGVPAEDLPGTALLPGLVNVHTHLELTQFHGTIDDDAFPDWILHVRRAKEAATPDQFLASALNGVRDAWRHGTTTVADTGDSGAVAHALTQLGGRGVVYQEVFGPDPAQAPAALDALKAQVAALREGLASSVVLGVSPHAPYTVSPALFRAVADYARAEGLPLAVHIAESQAEVSFVTQQTGPFAERWKARGLSLPAPARSPIAWLDQAGALGPNVLAIHAVRADAADIRLLTSRGTAVAVCPRSNARHGHGTAPLAAFRAAGLRLGLGTDSVASVNDLDLFAEARAAVESAGLSPTEAIRLLTLDGATALGLEPHVGSLEPGKWADLCMVRWDEGITAPNDVAAQVLRSGAGDVVRTYVAGRLVHRRDGARAS
jgi:cytosine/adenosine deaminase-related metal-dependent hydrolase